MYHPRLRGNHYDMGRHYGELLAKSGVVLCKTAGEAAKLLQNIPISSAHNIVVADSMGEMFAAECTSEQVSVRCCEKYAAATNHFITPAMQQYNAEDENWYQTRDRLATLESVLADEHMSFEKGKELISGKRGFLCQYEKKLPCVGDEQSKT